MARRNRIKTWKREIAAAGLLVWLAATVNIFLFVPAENVSQYYTVYDIMTTMVWAVAAAVFSIHGFQDAINKRLASEPEDPIDVQPPDSEAGGRSSDPRIFD